MPKDELVIEWLHKYNFYNYLAFLLKLFFKTVYYFNTFYNLPISHLFLKHTRPAIVMASSCAKTEPGSKKLMRCRPPPLVFNTETTQSTDDATESQLKVPHIYSWDKKLNENPKLLELFKAVLLAVNTARTIALADQEAKSFADYKPAEIMDGFSIGSQWDTTNENFKHLATVMDDPSLAMLLRPLPESREVFHARDDDDTDIMALFPKVRDYLDRCIKTGKPTLIHCHAGMNRSATLATAYYCYKTGKTLFEAISHLVSLRPIILRNGSFLAQLTIWAVDNGYAKCE